MASASPSREVSSAPPRSAWIISRGGDLAFVIGTPLLIMALLLPISWAVPTAQFPLILVGLCSIGHHLPGFMRMYGDRELMRRYRLRALVFPPVLFAGIFWLMQHQMTGVTMLILVWGFWHGLMQIYGFMRIYDAKQGRTDRLTARVDWWICAGCFAGMLFWSPSFARRFLDAGENTGVPFVSLIFSEPIQTVGLYAGGALAVMYVGYTAWMYASGRPVSVLKLLLLAITAGFLYVTWVLFEKNPWLGLGAWELFHDIQYFAIVWGYNCNLANREVATRFMRWLFRPRWWLLAAYVGLVLAYGGSQYVPVSISEHLLPAVFATSVILHFYFDGFIWKVRHRKTQRDLGLDETTGQSRVALEDNGSRLMGQLRDFSHLAFIVLPLVLLAVLEMYQTQLELPVRRALVRLVPSSAVDHYGLGEAYRRRGRLDEAIAQYNSALEEDPDLVAANVKLGLLYSERGESRTAAEHFRRVLDPSSQASNAEAAVSFAQVALGHNQRERAVEYLRIAAKKELEDKEAQDSELYDALARVLLGGSIGLNTPIEVQGSRGEFNEAVYWAEIACERTRRRDPHMLLTLAMAQMASGQAAAALETALLAGPPATSLGNSALVGEIELLVQRLESRAEVGN